MIITCEECSTRFTLDDSLIKPEGSKVRCSQCQHVFTAFPMVEEPIEPAVVTEDDTDLDFDLGDDFSESSDGDFEFEEPVSEADTQEDFSESQDIDFDDQDIDFDEIEFDGVDEFDPNDTALDAAGPDASEQEEGEFDGGDIEFDAPLDDLRETDVSDTVPEDDDLDLEFPELELEDFDSDEGDDEGIETEGDDETADIEISFDQDQDDSGIVDMGLEMEDSDNEADLEEIEFDTQDTGLELSLDDDPDGGLVFDTDTDQDLFDSPLTLEEAEEPAPEIPEYKPETEDLALSLEEDLTLGQEDMDQEKFDDYDKVLAQDVEPAEATPDLDLDQEIFPRTEADTDTSEKKEDVPEEVEPPQEEIESQLKSPLIKPQSAQDVRKKRAAAKKTGIGTPVKIMFLLFLLIIAAYIASLRLGADIPFLSQINIPFVTDALKPAPKTKQVPKPLPSETSIKGRFVSNQTAGELFIITGRVDNPADIAYSHIRVKGTLLNKDKAKAGTKTVYCGNTIAEETLKSGTLEEIDKLLQVQAGNQNTNVNIKPGKAVMFMIVFSDPPENLTNFTVEVVDFKTETEGK